MMRVALALLVLAAPALAQPRPFNCVGAEQLEDDAFAVPFTRGGAVLIPAAESALEAAVAAAKAAPERNICVLGHAAPQEGGAATGTRLAARRAGAVAEELAKRGVERDRIRAEARVAGFARNTPVPAERSVLVVILPE